MQAVVIEYSRPRGVPARRLPPSTLLAPWRHDRHGQIFPSRHARILKYEDTQNIKASSADGTSARRFKKPVSPCRTRRARRLAGLDYVSFVTFSVRRVNHPLFVRLTVFLFVLGLPLSIPVAPLFSAICHLTSPRLAYRRRLCAHYRAPGHDSVILGTAALAPSSPRDLPLYMTCT